MREMATVIDKPGAGFSIDKPIDEPIFINWYIEERQDRESGKMREESFEHQAILLRSGPAQPLDHPRLFILRSAGEPCGAPIGTVVC